MNKIVYAVFGALMLLLSLHGIAQSGMKRFEDIESGLSIAHPENWELKRLGGPAKIMFGERKGDQFLLCSVDAKEHKPPLPSTQEKLDYVLVDGFKTREWPQQLAGKRILLDFEIQDIGGIPMGAIEWEDNHMMESGYRGFARGMTAFRLTPNTLWKVECAAIGFTKPDAEAFFKSNVAVFGRIIASVRFRS